MQKIIISILAIFIFLEIPKTLLASESYKSSPVPGGFGFTALILFIICYSRRKKEIGGWLLYYFIQLYLATGILIIYALFSLSDYRPSTWDSTIRYALFLLTTIPGYLFLFAQTIVSFWLLSSEDRNWRNVNILRLIFLLDLIFSIVAIPINITLWPARVGFNVIALIWLAIWLSYFSFSKRVHSVYKNKDWSDLQQPKLPDEGHRGAL